MSKVTTLVKGVCDIGDVKVIDLQSPINSLIGRQVSKVRRSSGTGTVMTYALEYSYFTDFLVVGENQQTFDLKGDSRSLILLTGEGGEKPRPIGIIWGGTANRGRLKLKSGQNPENWTSGVDLGRLLDLLELDIITSSDGLQDGTLPRDKFEESYEPLSHNIQLYPLDSTFVSRMNACFELFEFCVENIGVATNVEEHQFIPSSTSLFPEHCKENSHKSTNLSALKMSSAEEFCASLPRTKETAIQPGFCYELTGINRAFHLAGPACPCMALLTS